MSEKSCKDCAYFREIGMCYHPHNSDPVSGKPETSAWSMREGPSNLNNGKHPNWCGRKGTWFVPSTDKAAYSEAQRRRDSIYGPTKSTTERREREATK